MSDFAALLLDQVAIVVLLALIESFKTGYATPHALTPHPAEITALKLVKHLLKRLLLQTVFVEELAAEDAETASRVRVDAKYRDLGARDHGCSAQVGSITAE